MSHNRNRYFDSVVKITENYLGPAAERFIRRQIEFHLSKEPRDITYADIPKLKESVRVALGLIVNDNKIVMQAVKELEQIKK